MANQVPLTRAHFKALRREAHRALENAIGERISFLGEDEGRKQERVVLACADVLGGLSRGEGDFVLRDADVSRVRFTDEAFAWLRTTRDGVDQHLRELDQTSHEGGPDYCAKEAYLIHTIDVVLAAQDGAQS
jgi:hypothetical protein